MSYQQVVVGIIVLFAFIGAIVGIVSAIMKKAHYQDYKKEGFAANNTTAYVLMGIGFPVALISFFFMVDSSLTSKSHLISIFTAIVGTIVGLIGTFNIH